MSWLTDLVGYVVSYFFSWWVYLIYVILMVVYYYFFADTGAASPNAPQPREVNIPTVTVTNPVPVLFGTMFIKNANVVWYGNVQSVPYEKCS